MRTSVLLLAALTAVTVAFGTGASAAPTTWPACPATSEFESVAQLRAARRVGDVRNNLWPRICGPTKVVPGTTYTFTVVITNITDTTYRRLKLSVSHYRPLDRSSLPYRREAASNGDPLMHGAVWTLQNLKPGRSFRVSFALSFTRHPDPKASGFEVDAFVAHAPFNPVNLLGMTHDVVFVRHSSSP